MIFSVVICKNTWNQANKYRLLLCELADRLGHVNYVGAAVNV